MSSVYGFFGFGAGLTPATVKETKIGRDVPLPSIAAHARPDFTASNA
jgi:hypothetical protein